MLEVILSYIVSSRLAWTTQELLSKTRITFGSVCILVAIFFLGNSGWFALRRLLYRFSSAHLHLVDKLFGGFRR